MNKGFLTKLVFFTMLGVAIAAIIFIAISGSNVSTGTGGKTLFQQFIVSGGPIVWFVLLPLSFLTLLLVIEYAITIRIKKLAGHGISGQIIENVKKSGIISLLSHLNDKQDFVSIAVLEAIQKGKGDWLRIKTALTESLQDQAAALIRKIEWLNLIGNVSPMVGLFGTVFGMIKLFNAIVIAGGQPQPVHLADGISVALVTTFWGLLIAIPALAAHGVFMNKLEAILAAAINEAEEAMPVIRKHILLKNNAPQVKKQPIKEFGQKTKKTQINNLKLT